MELSSVDGIITDGEPSFHMTFQNIDRPYSAHLEQGSVLRYIAEIVLAEIRVLNWYGV